MGYGILNSATSQHLRDTTITYRDSLIRIGYRIKLITQEEAFLKFIPVVPVTDHTGMKRRFYHMGSGKPVANLTLIYV